MHDWVFFVGDRDDRALPMPRTIAGRIEFVENLLLGVPLVDDDGNLTGERSGPMITEEQAREMLSEVRDG